MSGSGDGTSFQLSLSDSAEEVYSDSGKTTLPTVQNLQVFEEIVIPES